MRQIAYWSVFAGTCGHTYGCNPVWQFYDTNRVPITFVHTPWRQALKDEGASDMKYLRRLIESRSMFDRVPDQSIIVKGEGIGANHCVATRGRNCAFIYVPTGYPLTVHLGSISCDSCCASWFNPRNGETTLIGVFRNAGEAEFAPPGISRDQQWLKTGRGCDWVLILDDASAQAGGRGRE